MRVARRAHREAMEKSIVKYAVLVYCLEPIREGDAGRPEQYRRVQSPRNHPLLLALAYGIDPLSSRFLASKSKEQHHHSQQCY